MMIMICEPTLFEHLCLWHAPCLATRKASQRGMPFAQTLRLRTNTKKKTRSCQLMARPSLASATASKSGCPLRRVSRGPRMRTPANQQRGVPFHGMPLPCDHEGIPNRVALCAESEVENKHEEATRSGQLMARPSLASARASKKWMRFCAKRTTPIQRQ